MPAMLVYKVGSSPKPYNNYKAQTVTYQGIEDQVIIQVWDCILHQNVEQRIEQVLEKL